MTGEATKVMRSFFETVTAQHTLVFARTLVGLLLLTAGISKLGNHREFLEVVRDYRLLPENASRFVGRLIPVIEMLVSAGLLFAVLALWMSMAATALFLLFGSAVAINLLRGRRDISCGCFGPNQNHHLTWGLVARNGILAGLASLVWLVSPRAVGVEQLPIAETVATGLIAGAALASWWLCGVIIRMWRPPDDGHLLLS